MFASSNFKDSCLLGCDTTKNGKHLLASDLKVHAARLPIILVTVYQSTWCHTPKYLTPIQLTVLAQYEVLPQNSGNLNSVPEPVVVCTSAARCG